MLIAETPEPGRLSVTLLIDLKNASEEPEDAEWAKIHTIEVEPEIDSLKQKITFSFPIVLYGSQQVISCTGYFMPRANGPVITGLYSVDGREQGAFLVQRDQGAVPQYRHEE